MQFKSADGQSYNVTSQNQGNWNSAGGILGAASFFGINAGSLFGGNRGYGYGYGCGCNNDGGCSDNTMVNRYELNMTREADSLKAENALLRADKYTDQKIVEATAYLQGEIGKVDAKLESFKDSQNAVNMQQTALNATQTATISAMSAQIAQLQSLSQLVVPQNKVCDTCCCGCAQ